MLKFIIPIIVGVFTFFIVKYGKETGYKGFRYTDPKSGTLIKADPRNRFSLYK